MNDLPGCGRPKLTAGIDTPLFYLDADPRWRLASDGLQWIIQKRDGMQHEGRYAGERRWKNVPFSTTPEVLRRDMRELGIEPTAETLRRIGEFPPHVARWKWDGRSLEGDDADVEREPHPRDSRSPTPQCRPRCSGKVTTMWEERFGELVAYKERGGDWSGSALFGAPEKEISGIGHRLIFILSR